MPVDLVPADPHGRELEAVAEVPALVRSLARGARIASRSALGPSRSEAVVGRPDLGVAGHRLAVEAESSAAVLKRTCAIRSSLGPDRRRFVVALDPGASMGMRPVVGVAEGAMVGVGAGHAGPRLVQPARLRHAQPVRAVVAGDEVEEGNLDRQR